MSGQSRDLAALSLVYVKADQHEQPWLQFYSDGSVTNYVERDGRGTPLGLVNSSGSYAYVLDGLGSVTVVVDAAGTVVAAHSYDAYGQTVAATGSVLGTNLPRYTGGLNMTPDISPVKLGQRWYSTAIGRFTQQDLLTFLGDTKLGERRNLRGHRCGGGGEPLGAGAAHLLTGCPLRPGVARTRRVTP
ncbi:hypothetical protein [Nonomuraea guangzhouensis]|uniref:Teneurin-like YD-shell domain-containing protein n=1 Tax=Nonomuraea guangzhouensis TaxID=1291555 RepID=A0ABW4GGM5_9ACTN|nr:hypothetical protein [Nonomuraea guangzhouensis]